MSIVLYVYDSFVCLVLRKKSGSILPKLCTLALRSQSIGAFFCPNFYFKISLSSWVKLREHHFVPCVGIAIVRRRVDGRAEVHPFLLFEALHRL